MVLSLLILFAVVRGQFGSFEDCYDGIYCSEDLEFIIPNKKCSKMNSWFILFGLRFAEKIAFVLGRYHYDTFQLHFLFLFRLFKMISWKLRLMIYLSSDMIHSSKENILKTIVMTHFDNSFNVIVEVIDFLLNCESTELSTAWEL